MAYADFKDLARRIASVKVFRDKAFNIAKNPKYDGYQRELASMVFKFFDKKCASGSGVTIMRLSKIYNQRKNYTNQLLETLKKEQFIENLKTIFGVMIQLICN